MSKEDIPGSKQDFDKRLAQARSGDVERGPAARNALPKKGIAMASRIGTELAASIAVGVGIGLLLDNWLETKPWFLIGFTLLGSVAGFLNVYRLSAAYTASMTGKTDNED